MPASFAPQTSPADFVKLAQSTADDHLTFAQCPDCFQFLSEHDFPRITKPATCLAETSATLAMATVLLGAPGLPIIYYGDEQGFNGNCPTSSAISAGSAKFTFVQQKCLQADDDAFYRQDMWTGAPFLLSSAVPSIAKMARISPSWCPSSVPAMPWQDEPLLSRTHRLYQDTKRLLALRQSCPALRRGSTRYHDLGQYGHLLGTSRLFEGSEVILLINLEYNGNAAAIDQLKLTSSPPAGAKFRNALTGLLAGVVMHTVTGTVLNMSSGASSEYGDSFAVPPREAAVLVRDDELLPWDDNLHVTLCKHTSSATLPPPQPPIDPISAAPPPMPAAPAPDASFCCGQAVDVTAGPCSTGQCAVDVRIDMAAYAPMPWWHISIWTNLFGNIVPTELAGGVYQASVLVPPKQTLVYSIDVNERRGVNDQCSALLTDSSDPELFNR